MLDVAMKVTVVSKICSCIELGADGTVYHNASTGAVYEIISAILGDLLAVTPCKNHEGNYKRAGWLKRRFNLPC